jgi:hypothetical protein
MQLSFDNIQFKEEFDGVWACASLLHLTREKAMAAMMRLTTALKPGGVIFVALKVGEGNKTDSGRYFEYYDENSVKELYEHDPRIKILNKWRSPPSSLEENGTEWLNLILQRKEYNPFKAS